MDGEAESTNIAVSRRITETCGGTRTITVRVSVTGEQKRRYPAAEDQAEVHVTVAAPIGTLVP